MSDKDRQTQTTDRRRIAYMKPLLTTKRSFFRDWIRANAFIAGLFCVVVLAFFFPEPGAKGGMASCRISQRLGLSVDHVSAGTVDAARKGETGCRQLAITYLNSKLTSVSGQPLTVRNKNMSRALAAAAALFGVPSGKNCRFPWNWTRAYHSFVNRRWPSTMYGCRKTALCQKRISVFGKWLRFFIS
jgi:hypothetical protein